MAHSVTTHLVQIGSEQGVRIPQRLLEQVGLTGEVQIEVDDNRLILRSAAGRRQDWDEQFRQMAAQGDDKLLDGDAASLTEWDNAEWEW